MPGDTGPAGEAVMVHGSSWRALGFVVVSISLRGGPAAAAVSPQVPLAPKVIPQFTQALPTLSVAPQNGSIATVTGNVPLRLTMCEMQAKVLPVGTITPGVQTTTTVWGYVVGDTCPGGVQETYIGPVIVSARGAGPTTVTYANALGSAATTGVLAYRYGTDLTLHWADPFGLMCSENAGIPAFGSACAQNYDGPIPAVTHLHGGEVPPEIDGGPDAWFTATGMQGPGYYSSTAAANAATYAYPNRQEAAPLWFHDHTLGATRLNVYAGLAGVYYIVDPGLSLPPNLPPIEEVVPLVIQDRSFDTNGQLVFPADSLGGVLWTPNPEHPYWVPELVGDVIAVNGRAWPYLDVQPRRYRFLLLNGSNARAYELSLTAQGGGPDPAMYVIATDGGFLDAPVAIAPAAGHGLVMMPGERYEVIIDFGGLGGATVEMRNTGRTPFPKGAPPQGSTLGRVLQFRVAACAGTCPPDTSFDPAAPGAVLRTGDRAIARLVDPATGTVAAGVTPSAVRQLTLNEVMGAPRKVIDPVTGVLTAYKGGPLEILLNNSKWSGVNAVTGEPIPGSTVAGVNYATEAPGEGTIEQWEIVNLTADAHPIHLHLVQFQLLNRQAFNTGRYAKTYAAAFPGVAGSAICLPGVFCPGYGPPLDYRTGNPRALGGNPDITPALQGKAQPPEPQEAGWKDTVIAYPGMVTRFVVRWAPMSLPASTPVSAAFFPFSPTGDGLYSYVWHCHIIDHEDNEMMRPTSVQANPVAVRSLLKGSDY